MFSLRLCLLFLLVDPAHMYTKVPGDYDLYGSKLALNDALLMCLDNLYSLWYLVVLDGDTSLSCTAPYSLTTCDFVYSAITPITNNRSFVYNCIDIQGNNVVGHIGHVNMCNFQLIDERIVSNYSTQDNFVIAIDAQGTGVYGVADDFLFYYELQPTPHLDVWPNTLGISPRAIDIGANNDFAVVVGYCQSSPSKASECGALLQLNRSASCPAKVKDFPLLNNLTYPWTDPRATHFVTQSRVYAASLVMSVSIAWHARLILVGVPALNTVLLYSMDNMDWPISVRQNGIGFMGYGKSVAWLDSYGHKAAVLANTYSFNTYEWISSSIHVYNILTDGFSDSTKPILAYPNSQQIRHPTLLPKLIRITASPSGSVGILDILGNEIAILNAPAGSYASTNTTGLFVSAAAPCNPGTYRDYPGVELCYPIPSSSNYSLCTSADAFCPYGAVGEVSHEAFESIEQEQDYPESPENTVFDDLLMQNMLSLNVKSSHCILVSPLTWVIVVIGLGCSVALSISISEWLCPNEHAMRDRAKTIFRKMDLVGEGEVRSSTFQSPDSYRLFPPFSSGSVASSRRPSSSS